MTMSKPLKTTNTGGDVEQQELSLIVGENAKWNSLFGGQLGRFLQN